MIPEYYSAESTEISVARETDGGQEQGIQKDWVVAWAGQAQEPAACLLNTRTTQQLGKLGQGQS